MPKKTDSTTPAAPPLPPGLEEAIRRIVREVVTTENDIELSIPDEEIERIAAKVIAPLSERVAALESATTSAPTVTTTAARVTVTPKAKRLDNLRASAARTKPAAKATTAKTTASSQGDN